ncbi:FAD-dependent oxidoreductase [Polaribacter porphyrae]|uniref:Oxidoreductase n=1 Tax=Polaribacter porphyrae TaxID=1137780 RepID=A0A2S7WP11_9FLAO|nr:FAD-dependent oxidoreductase [Polaribacter porphyrae]PQJ79340.1 oxidoreductase [Polaribacter porphyrae]
MKKSEYKIYIIGAGVSGLIAAQVLENHGYSPVIIEATSTVGGRVKSDIVDDYILDHGFQVLLSAYPATKKYLSFSDLELQTLMPGATIFNNGKTQTIGDPLRSLSLLFLTVFASVGSFSDKRKILKLNILLKKKKIAAIFKEKEQTTLQYLKDYGFSDKIISNFFKPFFSGIFLESNLETSSRMFQFVYKMFGEGNAVIPKNGIQEISNQLKNKLENTEFLFNTKVKEVLDDKIVLENNTELKSHITIIATEASSLIANLKNQETDWKSCDTLYFKTEKRVLQKPLIGLIADENSLVNNIFYHTSVATASKGNKELLSVTVVKNHTLNEKELLKKVQDDLDNYCAISGAIFLKRYQIKKALPKLSNLQYEISSTETKLKSTIFLAGDQLLNGSLNAAMISGERAALGVIQTLEDGLIVDELTSEYS